MAKLKSIIGLPIEDLYSMLNEKELIQARRARLIPAQKPGDEIALASVFLSSLRLVKEFRTMISKNIELTTSGKLHVFTEITFSDFESSRPDGMVCVERGGKIVDAALFEMKNGKIPLDKAQIGRYAEIADCYKIPKIVTVSNHFVSNPRQSPVTLTGRRKVQLFHLSWSFILTLAYILLTDNDINIEDPDQVNIMQEVVDYLEHEKNGVSGFTTMKEGWKILAERINKGENIKPTDKDVNEAVESWLQEERDMALILSRKLGLLVETGVKKYKDDLTGRIANESKNIVSDKKIESVFRIKDTASPVTVVADFTRRNIEYQTTLPAPLDKQTLRGQVGWIKKQIDKMKKNPEIFNNIKDQLFISFRFKNFPGVERIHIGKIETFYENHKTKTLRNYDVSMICSLGKNFGSTKNSIKIIEESLLAFYQGVVQHLERWTPPAPEIKTTQEPHIIEDDN